MPTLEGKCGICGAPSWYAGKYAACPECSFKIHEEVKSSFFAKYPPAKFLEVLKEYGGDNFSGSYEATLDKFRVAHSKKTMSKPKLNSSCCICGSPCHKTAFKFSTCVECALKVYQAEDPKITKKSLKETAKDCEELGGEGFGKDWAKHIEQVKSEHSASKIHFDCHHHETSVCRGHKGKHIAQHDLDTQKTYVVKGVKGKDQWEEVRLCQNHFDTRTDKGWLKSYEFQELIDKKLDLKDLKGGQRVEFEILKGANVGHKGWATVIEESNNNGGETLIYWDLPNATSWEATKASVVAAIKELGLKPEGKNVWSCRASELKVLRAFQPIETPAPAKTPAPSSPYPKIEVGQIWKDKSGCQLQITKVVPGMASAKCLKGGTWTEGFVYNHFTSLDTEDRSPYFVEGWEMLPPGEKTQTVKLSDLKEGQRVEVRVKSGSVAGHKSWAVIIKEGAAPVIHWENPPYGAWFPHGQYATNAAKYGLTTTTQSGWYCYDTDVEIVQVGEILQPVVKAKPTPPATIKLSDLKEGQRAELRMTSLVDKGLTGWATVLRGGNSTGDVVVYWEDKAPNGAWAGAKYSQYREKIDKYGLDGDAKKFWHCYSDQIEILQVKDAEVKTALPKFDLKDFKEGERLKITYQVGTDKEHTTWATVLVSQGKSKQGDTLLYFDQQGGRSWGDLQGRPDAVEAEIMVRHLGLDPDAGKYRYCRSDDTVVLDRAPAIQLKDLEVGDRLHMYVGDNHYTWATVIKACSSNPVIHLDNPKKLSSGDNDAIENSNYDHVAADYGLREGKYYWGLVDGMKDTQILGKGKKLEKVKPTPKKEISFENLDVSFNDLKEGDRVKIIVEGEHGTWATVVMPKGDHSTDGVVFYFDTEGADSYPHNDIGIVAVCKKLGLDHTKKRFRNLTASWVKILEKAPPIDPTTLQVGDRVQVRIRDKFDTWATVIAADGGKNPTLHVDTIVPIEFDGGSWRASYQDNQAAQLGLSTKENRFWTAYGTSTKFLSKAGKYLPVEVKNEEAPKVKSELKLSDCKQGERIKVEHLGIKSWATVVCTKGQDTSFKDTIVLAFLENTDALGCWNAYEGTDVDKCVRANAQKLGFDTASPQFRRCYDGDTKVLERPQATPTLKDLKEGDRIYVSLLDKQSVWATVIEAKNTPVLHLDTRVNESSGQSWGNEYYDTVAARYGIKAGQKNYWTASEANVKILTQGMSLPQQEIINVASEADKTEKEPAMKTKYRVGEKIRIKPNYEDREFDAHVIGYDTYDKQTPILWLEDKSGIGWKPTNKKQIKTVQDLGLGRGGARNCYHLDSGVKVVKRYEQVSEKEKGEEDMSKRKWKVGDRVKIRTTSSYPFTGWGTIISLKGLDGDPNQPLLFMDEEYDDTWPWDEESQRKAAIKAGKDPESASFWWLCEDDDTEVLEQEKEEKMEEKNFMGMVKGDMVDAGYRVAGKQMTKGVKAALLKLFADKGADSSKLKVIEEVLDSEIGLAAISLLLGYGAAYVPGIGQDPRFQRLSKEFRVEGFATAGNAVADTLLTYLAPAIMEGVSKLPPVGELAASAAEKTGIKKKTKKRVAPAAVRVKDAPKVEEQHEEEESKKEALAATG